MMKMFAALKAPGLSSIHELKLDPSTFKTVVSENIVLVNKAFKNQMVVPAFETFCDNITDIYKIVRTYLGT